MLLEELTESFLFSRKNGVSGAKGIARPKTLKFYECGLQRFIAYMQTTRQRTNYEDITRNDMRAFVEFVHSHPSWKSKNTKYGILRCVRSFMNFIEKDAECQEAHLRGYTNVLGVIPKNEVRKVIPSVRGVKDVRGQFDPRKFYGLRNYAIFNMLVATGLRNGEIRNLKLTDLHLEDRILHVPEEGKTGTRLVPMDTTLIGVLKAWLSRRRQMQHATDSPWLFPARGGGQLQENAIGQAFRKVQAGVPRAGRITPHTLRHFFGTHYLSKSGNMERCRLILGHKSYETLKIYLHMSQATGDEGKDEMERVSPLKTVNASR